MRQGPIGDYIEYLPLQFARTINWLTAEFAALSGRYNSHFFLPPVDGTSDKGFPYIEGEIGCKSSALSKKRPPSFGGQ